MTLLLDIGNSRIKPALLHGDTLQPLPAGDYDPQQLIAWCANTLAGFSPPSAVRVANVAGERVAADLATWCRQQWQIEPQFAITQAAAGGVRNGYETIADLGVDRWLALIAARRKTSAAVCVISAGTALTVDALDATGEHRGGLILPGVQLMQQALHQATYAVRAQPGLPAQLAPGRSTAAGVAAGSGYAIAGLIDCVMNDLAVDSGSPWQGMLTGGGAAAIAPLCRRPVQIEPHLVLEGLAWYARGENASSTHPSSLK